MVKSNIILFILILLGGITIGGISACMFDDYLLTEVKIDNTKDSILRAELKFQDSIINELIKDKIILEFKADSLGVEMFKSIETIESLCKPEVTKQDHKNALKWIEEYNSSLD